MIVRMNITSLSDCVIGVDIDRVVQKEDSIRRKYYCSMGIALIHIGNEYGTNNEIYLDCENAINIMVIGGLY